MRGGVLSFSYVRLPLSRFRHSVMCSLLVEKFALICEIFLFSPLLVSCYLLSCSWGGHYFPLFLFRIRVHRFYFCVLSVDSFASSIRYAECLGVSSFISSCYVICDISISCLSTTGRFPKRFLRLRFSCSRGGGFTETMDLWHYLSH